MAQIKEISSDTLAIFQKVIRYFHERVKGNHQDIDSLTEMFEDEFNRLYNLKKNLQDCLSRQSGKKLQRLKITWQRVHQQNQWQITLQ